MFRPSLLLCTCIFLCACAAKTSTESQENNVGAVNTAQLSESDSYRVSMQWIEPDETSPVALIADHRYAFAPQHKVEGTEDNEDEATGTLIEKTAEKVALEIEKPIRKSATTIKIVPLEADPIIAQDGSGLVLGNPEDAPDDLMRFEDKEKPADGSAVRVTMEKGPLLPVTILFDLDKADLREDAKTALNRLPRGSSVQITAYTCDLGDDDYNLILSQQRADSVAKYLTSRGLVVTNQTGKGECCPVSPVKADNRRATISRSTAP